MYTGHYTNSGIIKCVCFAVLSEVVLTDSHDTKHRRLDIDHQESSANQYDDTRWIQALAKRSRPEEKYEMSFIGDCKPFEDSNSTLLHFWGHFLDKISVSFNISKDSVKAKDLFLGKPIRLTFSIEDPVSDIPFVKRVESMIKSRQFIISIPESNYSAIAIKPSIEEDVSDKTSQLSRLYVILIVCVSSIFTVSINIALCSRFANRSYNFHPRGHPTVKYSMKEMLQTWEKREKGKQSKDETLSRANTMEMTETFRPSERKQEIKQGRQQSRH